MDKGIKLQAYKQRHGHDINGVRPVMIPDESGDWVSRFDAEHLAEQLARAQCRIAELESAPSGMMKRKRAELPENVIAEVCLAAAEIHNRGCGVDDDKAQFIIDRIRMYLSNVGTVEGSE